MAKLSPRTATAVITYVEERLASNPERLSKPLRADMDGLRSSRNGSYRILFRLTGSSILIVRVDHRADVYRRLD